MREQISNILFLLAGFLWAIEVIPQIIKTIKTKKVKDISVPFFVLCVCAYCVFLTGALIIKNWYLIFSHLPSFIFMTIMTVLVFKYRKKR